MDDHNILEIKLDPSGVAGPAQRVATIASQVVGTALRALSNDDLSPPPMQGEHWGYRFGDLGMNDEERRETFRNWILSKGFQDLARGVRETLEEAVLYLSVLKRPPGMTTLAKVEAEFADIRADASKLNFPTLLETVNAGLTERMAFDAEFLSLQKVRNCLEHRGGRVGARDLDAGGSMTLSFPRMRMFYYRGQDEIEVMPGEVIDTHSLDNPFKPGEEVSIYLNRVTRTRTYALDEPVVISASDFYEIAMACHLFASDVVAKLPTLPASDVASLPEPEQPLVPDR